MNSDGFCIVSFTRKSTDGKDYLEFPFAHRPQKAPASAVTTGSKTRSIGSVGTPCISTTTIPNIPETTITPIRTRMLVPIALRLLSLIRRASSSRSLWSCPCVCVRTISSGGSGEDNFGYRSVRTLDEEFAALRDGVVVQIGENEALANDGRLVAVVRGEAL
jgi:hypothetical protein